MIAGSLVVFWSPLTVITFMTDVRKIPVLYYSRAYVFTLTATITTEAMVFAEH